MKFTTYPCLIVAFGVLFSYRKKSNMSQLDLALEIGIKSVAFYSNCENCKYDKHFNLEHLYKIAKALKINICCLLDDDL
jgi:transcriptional regulator with XRE-family HTH domain